MYETTQNLTPASRTNRRAWLAIGTGLAAVLVLLILVAAACQARSDGTDPVAGGAGTTPTPSASDPSAEPADQDGEPASGVGEGGENPGGGNSGGGSSGGGNSGGGGEDPDEDDDSEDPDDGEEPVAPLSIEPAITAVAPNGHCSASGTITVEGGEYPLEVEFQWRQLTWILHSEPVSPVQSYTFDEPGGISVQTKDLPEDGLNVFLTVSSPKSASSSVVEYDGCSGQAGGGTIGG